MASQLLPNCSDFRVEYTYDDPREVGDPAQPLPAYGKDPLDPGFLYPNTYVHPIRWLAVIAGEEMVWSRLAVSQNGNDRTDPHRWPRALRITLRCWDAGGRLNEPVTYTMVHTWPSGE